MSIWRQLAHGFRTLTNRSAADRDLDDEVHHYLEQAAAAHVARGLSPEEALRVARVELGGVKSVREEVRGYGWENVIETLVTDTRYAARRLRAAPGFTAIATFTLALGIGAATAILSAVNPILFQSLPYPDAGRITMIWDRGADGSRDDIAFGTYRELQERARSFDALAALRPWQPTITGPAEPERLEGQQVSASYFQVLGVRPALGRDFDSSDDRLDGPRVVILGNELWQRRFGGDPAIVGSQISVGDEPYSVVGVMPRGFENVLAPAAEVWTPLQYDMSQGRAWGHHLRMVGRLRPGVGTESAGRELDGIARTPVSDFPRMPWASLGNGLIANRLQDDVTRDVKPALLAILGAAALVLVLASVNVTNLLLARGAHRREEFALRAALGAGRGRLIRQLLAESLLLAAMGGAAGMAVAMVGVRALVAISPPELPRLNAIRVDGTVFLLGLVTTTLVGLVAGVIPALQAAGSDPRAALQGGSRRTVGGHHGIRSFLVVAEVALAVVLLVSSGLLLRSMERLLAVSTGFDSNGLLTMQVQTSGRRFENAEATFRFFAQALEAVRHVPGVASAALTSQLPMSGDVDRYGIRFETTDAASHREDGDAFRYAVSPGYFETMRVPLRNGRLLAESDRQGAALVALISESAAKRRLPGVDPIGRRLRIGAEDSPPYTIVGVVGDVRQVSQALGERDAVYTSAAQWRFADGAMSVVVRAKGDASPLAAAVRQAVWSVDKDQSIVRVATMSDLVTRSAAERRFTLILFEAFALAALVLAAAGIYGVLAGSVEERRREIGVRSALGATRREIVALVVRQGMTLTGLGVAIGMVAAFVATQAIVAMLFGVSRLDPATYFGVVALLSAVALVASGVPSWRAARVDPARTLRAE